MGNYDKREIHKPDWICYRSPKQINSFLNQFQVKEMFLHASSVAQRKSNGEFYHINDQIKLER